MRARGCRLWSLKLFSRHSSHGPKIPEPVLLQVAELAAHRGCALPIRKPDHNSHVRSRRTAPLPASTLRAPKDGNVSIMVPERSVTCVSERPVDPAMITRRRLSQRFRLFSPNRIPVPAATWRGTRPEPPLPAGEPLVYSASGESYGAALFHLSFPPGSPFASTGGCPKGGTPSLVSPYLIEKQSLNPKSSFQNELETNFPFDPAQLVQKTTTSPQQLPPSPRRFVSLQNPVPSRASRTLARRARSPPRSAQSPSSRTRLRRSRRGIRHPPNRPRLSPLPIRADGGRLRRERAWPVGPSGISELAEHLRAALPPGKP